jgi:hypothetical protein
MIPLRVRKRELDHLVKASIDGNFFLAHDTLSSSGTMA